MKHTENNIVIKGFLEENTVDDLIEISKERAEKEREIYLRSIVHPDFLDDDEDIEITQLENEEPQKLKSPNFFLKILNKFKSKN